MSKKRQGVRIATSQSGHRVAIRTVTTETGRAPAQLASLLALRLVTVHGREDGTVRRVEDGCVFADAPKNTLRA